ncbi:MAG: glycoside hydrolase family 99-like domain-containing protein [Bacteroidales bacterium]|nr:glycoside hydrolase family 99-like domain-containing protein [Bacteroidales bacterium]
MKNTLSIALVTFICLAACNPSKNTDDETDSEKITVVSYYFPNYHPTDARMNLLKGKEWSEWVLVKEAKPRFKGHQQPNVPLWGYTDESDPSVMACKIDAAADYGIDAFIFDWYWDNKGIYWERGLEQGFLQAPNNNRLQFALMWAMSDFYDLFPYR